MFACYYRKSKYQLKVDWEGHQTHEIWKLKDEVGYDRMLFENIPQETLNEEANRLGMKKLQYTKSDEYYPAIVVDFYDRLEEQEYSTQMSIDYTMNEKLRSFKITK